MGHKKRKIKHREVEKSSEWKRFLYMGAIILLFIMVNVVPWLYDKIPRNQYMTQLRVCQGAILAQETDVVNGQNKHYAKVEPECSEGITLSEEFMWLESDPDFLQQHMNNKTVGLLLGNYDVFREKYWGLFGKQGQVFEKNIWVVEDIYHSKQEAETANAYRKFTQKATISEKNTLDDGRLFFAISCEERTMPVQVDQAVFDRYQVNNEIDCEFEGQGDFIKFVQFVHEP